jgi:predicted SnoaL-like aldol condensation-catalyzing enzyme
MKKSFLTFATAGLLTLTACEFTPMNSEQSIEPSNKEKAVALLNSIETGDQSAVSYVNPTKYTQHNLMVADGLAGFGAVLQALPKNNAKVNVIRSFTDGDYVFTHTDYNFFGPKVGFDIFKFEEGLIVEHWDNLAEKSTTPNPSGRTQIDGPTKAQDLDKTEKNKALVANFVNTILVKGEFDKLSSFFDGDNYLQHNTMITDGLSGLGQALEAMAKNGIIMVYSTNHKILGEGNFVLSISEGSFAGKPTSFYDLFRVENGKIVEHWDVMETIAPKEEWKNTNGKFGNL